MLYVTDLNILRAYARHHPDGRPTDPHERHRREATLQRRRARRAALGGWLRRIARKLRGKAAPAPAAACRS
jgi:hypothetical protein